MIRKVIAAFLVIQMVFCPSAPGQTSPPSGKFKLKVNQEKDGRLTVNVNNQMIYRGPVCCKAEKQSCSVKFPCCSCELSKFSPCGTSVDDELFSSLMQSMPEPKPGESAEEKLNQFLKEKRDKYVEELLSSKKLGVEVKQPGVLGIDLNVLARQHNTYPGGIQIKTAQYKSSYMQNGKLQQIIRPLGYEIIANGRVVGFRSFDGTYSTDMTPEGNMIETTVEPHENNCKKITKRNVIIAPNDGRWEYPMREKFKEQQLRDEWPNIEKAYRAQAEAEAKKEQVERDRWVRDQEYGYSFVDGWVHDLFGGMSDEDRKKDLEGRIKQKIQDKRKEFIEKTIPEKYMKLTQQQRAALEKQVKDEYVRQQEKNTWRVQAAIVCDGKIVSQSTILGDGTRIVPKEINGITINGIYTPKDEEKGKDKIGTQFSGFSIGPIHFQKPNELKDEIKHLEEQIKWKEQALEREKQTLESFKKQNLEPAAESQKSVVNNLQSEINELKASAQAKEAERKKILASHDPKAIAEAVINGSHLKGKFKTDAERQQAIEALSKAIGDIINKPICEQAYHNGVLMENKDKCQPASNFLDSLQINVGPDGKIQINPKPKLGVSLPIHSEYWAAFFDPETGEPIKSTAIPGYPSQPSLTVATRVPGTDQFRRETEYLVGQCAKLEWSEKTTNEREDFLIWQGATYRVTKRHVTPKECNDKGGWSTTRAPVEVEELRDKIRGNALEQTGEIIGDISKAIPPLHWAGKKLGEGAAAFWSFINAHPHLFFGPTGMLWDMADPNRARVHGINAQLQFDRLIGRPEDTQAFRSRLTPEEQKKFDELMREAVQERRRKDLQSRGVTEKSALSAGCLNSSITRRQMTKEEQDAYLKSLGYGTILAQDGRVLDGAVAQFIGGIAESLPMLALLGPLGEGYLLADIIHVAFMLQMAGGLASSSVAAWDAYQRGDNVALSEALGSGAMDALFLGMMALHKFRDNQSKPGALEKTRVDLEGKLKEVDKKIAETKARIEELSQKPKDTLTSVEQAELHYRKKQISQFDQGKALLNETLKTINERIEMFEQIKESSKDPAARDKMIEELKKRQAELDEKIKKMNEEIRQALEAEKARAAKAGEQPFQNGIPPDLQKKIEDFSRMQNQKEWLEGQRKRLVEEAETATPETLDKKLEKTKEELKKLEEETKAKLEKAGKEGITDPAARLDILKSLNRINELRDQSQRLNLRKQEIEFNQKQQQIQNEVAKLNEEVNKVAKEACTECSQGKISQAEAQAKVDKINVEGRCEDLRAQAEGCPQCEGRRPTRTQQMLNAIREAYLDTRNSTGLLAMFLRFYERQLMQMAIEEGGRTAELGPRFKPEPPRTSEVVPPRAEQPSTSQLGPPPRPVEPGGTAQLGPRPQVPPVEGGGTAQLGPRPPAAAPAEGGGTAQLGPRPTPADPGGTAQHGKPSGQQTSEMNKWQQKLKDEILDHIREREEQLKHDMLKAQRDELNKQLKDAKTQEERNRLFDEFEKLEESLKNNPEYIKQMAELEKLKKRMLELTEYGEVGGEPGVGGPMDPLREQIAKIEEKRNATAEGSAERETLNKELEAKRKELKEKEKTTAREKLEAERKELQDKITKTEDAAEKAKLEKRLKDLEESIIERQGQGGERSAADQARYVRILEAFHKNLTDKIEALKREISETSDPERLRQLENELHDSEFFKNEVETKLKKSKGPDKIFDSSGKQEMCPATPQEAAPSEAPPAKPTDAEVRQNIENTPGRSSDEFRMGGGQETMIEAKDTTGDPKFVTSTDIGRLPYESAPRPPQPIPELPQSIRDVPKVEKVELPKDTTFLISEAHSGSDGAVIIGYKDGRPVAMKAEYPVEYAEIKNNPKLSETERAQKLKELEQQMDEKILRDYQGAKLAEAMGYGPKVHGIYTDPATGKRWVVTDIVPGDFPDARSAGRNITVQTVRDLLEIHKRANEMGRSLAHDFQYFVTPEGRIQIIDAGGLIEAGTPRGNTSALVANLRQILRHASPEVRSQAIAELAKQDGGRALLEKLKEGVKEHNTALKNRIYWENKNKKDVTDPTKLQQIEARIREDTKILEANNDVIRRIESELSDKPVKNQAPSADEAPTGEYKPKPDEEGNNAGSQAGESSNAPNPDKAAAKDKITPDAQKQVEKIYTPDAIDKFEEIVPSSGLREGSAKAMEDLSKLEEAQGIKKKTMTLEEAKALGLTEEQWRNHLQDVPYHENPQQYGQTPAQSPTAGATAIKDKVSQALDKNGKAVVAIDGREGVGKTSIDLQQQFPGKKVKVLHGDDYFDPAQRARAIQEALKDNDIVVFEGTDSFAQLKESGISPDLKVFLEAQEEARRAAIVRRGDRQTGTVAEQLSPERDAQNFYKTDAQRANADVVIDNTSNIKKQGQPSTGGPPEAEVPRPAAAQIEQPQTDLPIRSEMKEADICPKSEEPKTGEYRPATDGEKTGKFAPPTKEEIASDLMSQAQDLSGVWQRIPKAEKRALRLDEQQNIAEAQAERLESLADSMEALGPEFQARAKAIRERAQDFKKRAELLQKAIEAIDRGDLEMANELYREAYNAPPEETTPLQKEGKTIRKKQPPRNPYQPKPQETSKPPAVTESEEAIVERDGGSGKPVPPPGEKLPAPKDQTPKTPEEIRKEKEESVELGKTEEDLAKEAADEDSDIFADPKAKPKPKVEMPSQNPAKAKPAEPPSPTAPSEHRGAGAETLPPPKPLDWPATQRPKPADTNVQELRKQQSDLIKEINDTVEMRERKIEEMTAEGRDVSEIEDAIKGFDERITDLVKKSDDLNRRVEDLTRTQPIIPEQTIPRIPKETEVSPSGSKPFSPPDVEKIRAQVKDLEKEVARLRDEMRNAGTVPAWEDFLRDNQQKYGGDREKIERAWNDLSRESTKRAQAWIDKALELERAEDRLKEAERLQGAGSGDN